MTPSPSPALPPVSLTDLRAEVEHRARALGWLAEWSGPAQGEYLMRLRYTLLQLAAYGLQPESLDALRRYGVLGPQESWRRWVQTKSRAFAPVLTQLRVTAEHWEAFFEGAPLAQDLGVWHPVHRLTFWRWWWILMQDTFVSDDRWHVLHALEARDRRGG